MRRWGAAIVVVAGLAALTPGSVAGAGVLTVTPLDRPDDPVVLTGSALIPLLGVAPGDVVAFRRDADAWVQVPVQVDERAVVDFGSPPMTGPNPSTGAAGTVYGTVAAPGVPDTIGVTALQYTDPDTWVGPDPNPDLDGNDEVALMARDAGEAAGAVAPPEHVVATTGVELAVTDPLDPGAQGHLYLFAQDGTLDPSAGQSLVDYEFDLTSGNYRSTYKRADGPNPEDSTVTTANYTHHFADRWVSDRLTISAGGATGVDVLDRHRNLFAPGNCVRHENTFIDAEGAFVVNRVGPVRAIRSYVGANSGPLTQRTHVFYESRQEILTDLRVHAIPGMLDLFDYSPAASGMTYRNSAMSAPVTIDGNPDSVPTTRADWELVTGAPGSIVHSLDLETDVAFGAGTLQTYFLDDSTPSIALCTGDPDAYAISGLHVASGIPNTDPLRGAFDDLRGRRTITYRAPGTTVEQAAAIDARVEQPVEVAARRFSAFPAHPFSDVGGTSWIGPALDWAAYHELVDGVGGRFLPTEPVRRAQGVSVLWRQVDRPAGAAHGFTDVPDGAYYESALGWAGEQGLVTGYPDGTFRPRNVLTRGQAANMVWQAVGEPAATTGHGFADVAPEAYFAAALDWIDEQGLMSGYPDGTFRPRQPISRAQFVNLCFLLAGDVDAWSAFGPPPSTVRF